ncbi:hypothetical protein LCGC14_1996920, partial [marine sediment metagenome]
SQTARPGAPIIYGGSPGVFDMRTMAASISAVEAQMIDCAYIEVGKYLGLPTQAYIGMSDSKTLDAQAAAEATFSIFTAALSGGNLVHDVGYLESGLTSCMEMVLFGDEIIAMCRRLTRGVELDENALALDVIDAVGPGGGFLDTDHTLDNFRTAHWLPRFMDRRHFEAWSADGSPDMYDRLNTQVKSILEAHAAEPLPEDRREEIARILAAHEAQGVTP